MPIIAEHRGCDRSALTLVEMTLCLVILGYLALMAVPLAENSARRVQEMELRDSLRQIRRAIDRYHEIELRRRPGLDDREAYPPDLHALVEARLLRRIPANPLTGRADWVRVSTSDRARDPRPTGTDGRNVFDVLVPGEGRTLDGVRYADL